MTADRNIMEQIERDERWLAARIAQTPAPSAETLDTVRRAVSIECRTDVLDGLDHPVPDRAVLASVKRAVREELDRTGGRTSLARWRRTVGALSAAASIVLAIGLVRFLVPTETAERERGAGVLPPSPTGDTAGSIEQALEDMTLAFRTVEEGRDPALSLLDEEIDRLTVSPLEADIDPTEAELRAIGDEIDGVLSEWPSLSETG